LPDCRFNILRRLHKRHGNPIDAKFERKSQIVAIFFGDGINIQRCVGEIHALAIPQRGFVQHLG